MVDYWLDDFIYDVNYWLDDFIYDVVNYWLDDFIYDMVDYWLDDFIYDVVNYWLDDLLSMICWITASFSRPTCAFVELSYILYQLVLHSPQILLRTPQHLEQL